MFKSNSGKHATVQAGSQMSCCFGSGAARYFVASTPRRQLSKALLCLCWPTGPNPKTRVDWGWISYPL